MSQPQSDPRPRCWWLAIGPPKCYLALHRGGVDVNCGLSRDAHIARGKVHPNRIDGTVSGSWIGSVDRKFRKTNPSSSLPLSPSPSSGDSSSGVSSPLARAVTGAVRIASATSGRG